MPYRLLADAVLVLHLLFVLFVLVGGLAALRWPRLALLHLPAVLWGAALSFAGWVCPLTPLENHLRRLGGEAGYPGGFVENYLLPLLYPGDLTRQLQGVLGVLVLAVNGVVYGLLARRWRARRQRDGGPARSPLLSAPGALPERSPEREGTHRRNGLDWHALRKDRRKIGYIAGPSPHLRTKADPMSAPGTPPPPQVAAIVPAYNEAETLADVLSVLRDVPLVDEILVVSDGSTDDTVDIGRQMGVKTVDLRRNYGKALAMAMGVAHTRAPVVLFVDGDILNLSEYLLTQLVEPVLEDRADMVVGIRHRGWLIDAIHRSTGPLLSGIRCLRREIFEAVPEEYLKGFTVETALNWTCGQMGMRVETVVLHNLRHVVKERKRGLREGMRSRYAMFEAVFLAWVGLTLKRPTLRGGAPAAQRWPEAEFINW